LLKKVLDPDHSIFVERAIVVKPDGKAEEFTMNHRVSGSTFTLDDTKGTVKGTGTLFGPPWKWTYWKGAFEATNGARIEDENFLADPNVLVARKRISAPDGKVIGFMDITLKTITPTTFTILSSSLLQKGQTPPQENQPRPTNLCLVERSRRFSEVRFLLCICELLLASSRSKPLGQTWSALPASAGI